MDADLREIAETFDVRARGYASSDWHRRSAERLVELCRLQPGNRVMDAGTGTGFAALAAARIVGPEGHVLGIDISAGMLREARAALTESGLRNVELVEGDVVHLPQFESEMFDVITCATGLLYMSPHEALREWHRLLRRGGLLGFSAMSAGAPAGGRIFRDCAAACGVLLRDPWEPLGSVSACRRILEAAGFEVVEIVSEAIEFSPQDLSRAWESNFNAAGHSAVRRLSDHDQRALKEMYMNALDREGRSKPGTVERADMLYALGRR